MSIRKVSPAMQLAWVEYDGPDETEHLTPRELAMLRLGFFGGYVAAVADAEAIAIKWRDENKVARDRALSSGRRRHSFDGDETQLVMADQLDGAAIECNAIAGAIRALASGIETEGGNEVPSRSDESPAPEGGDAQ